MRIERILIDASQSYRAKYTTGIQRVVKNIIQNRKILEDNFKVEVIPVIFTKNGFINLDIGNTSLMSKQKTSLISKQKEILKKKLGNYPKIYSFLRYNLNLVRLIMQYLPEIPRENIIDITEGNNLIILPEPLWQLNIWHLNYIKKHSLRNAFLPLIYDIIPIENYLNNYDTSCKWCDKLFNRNFSKIIKHSKGIITISRSEKRNIEEYLVSKNIQKKVDFFYLGSNFDSKSRVYENPNDIDLENYFLMVGTLDPRKNQDFVIKAFEILWNNGFEDNLVIVGASSLTNPTLSKIKSSPFFNKRLFYYGYVSDNQLNFLYKNSKALIFASNREGFGLPLVEALSQGINVIASDIDVFKEIGKDCAVFFKRNNIEDFMEKIKTFRKKENLKCKDLPILTWEQSMHMLSQAIKNIIEQ